MESFGSLVSRLTGFLGKMEIDERLIADSGSLKLRGYYQISQEVIG